MMLVKFEFRVSHVSGPDHDWWQPTARRTPAPRVDADVARMREDDRYRNITVGPDPHESHSEADIVRSTSGLSAYCSVDGCTWHWDYD